MPPLLTDITDEELFEQLKHNSRDAFEKLFRKYYHPLWHYCLKFIRDKGSAEEVVQEFFIHLWEKRDTIIIKGSVKSYFHVAIKNRSFNILKRKLQLNIPIEEHLDRMHYEDDHLETADLENSIEEAINALPEKCKIIFLLSRKTFLSYKEIAEQLDISVKTVEVQMGIALGKLRNHLKKYTISLIAFVIAFCSSL